MWGLPDTVSLGNIFPHLYWRLNCFVALVLTKPVKEVVLWSLSSTGSCQMGTRKFCLRGYLFSFLSEHLFLLWRIQEATTLFLPLLGIQKHILTQKVEMWPRPGQSGYHFLMAIIMGERQVCDLSWGPVKANPGRCAEMPGEQMVSFCGCRSRPSHPYLGSVCLEMKITQSKAECRIRENQIPIITWTPGFWCAAVTPWPSWLCESIHYFCD